MGSRALAVIGVWLALAFACSSRDLAKKPSCKNGGACPPGWTCDLNAQCVFVGGVGGGFGGTFAGSGGTIGGSGGAWLGSACEQGSDCRSGLDCLRPEVDGGGPAKGMCSLDCNVTDPATCFGIGGGAQCLSLPGGSSFCMQGCSLGPAGFTSFDVNKCQGRSELACTPLQPSLPSGLCVPRCNADSDCGVSSYCHPKDGLCHAAPPLGLPVGEPCTTADDCRGSCAQVVSGTDAQAPLSVCTEACTFGVTNACGWTDTSSPAPAYCLFGADGIEPTYGPAPGDLGQCAKLCDCDDQCPSPLTCVAFYGGDPASILTQRAGYCAHAVSSIGPCG